MNSITTEYYYNDTGEDCITDCSISQNISSEFCPENTTFKSFGHDYLLPRHRNVYVALAVCHITLILIPSAFLSALAIFYSVKKLKKHPTNAVFLWICVDCFFAPCTYGLLMDISLIFDLPLLGRCEHHWEGLIFWLWYTCAVTTFHYLLAFGAITFYVSLKYDIKIVNLRQMNTALSVVVMFSIITASAWLISIETLVNSSCKIRGSFCYTFFKVEQRTAVIFLEVFRVGCVIVPVNAIVLTSVQLYFLKVKSSITNFDKTIAKSIVLLFVVLSGGSMLWSVPTFIMHFGSFDGTQRGLMEMLSSYTLQLNFALFPLLVLILHRDAVKETFLNIVDRCLDLMCAPCCDNICCNLRGVSMQVQQNIKLTKKSPHPKNTTEKAIDA